MKTHLIYPMPKQQTWNGTLKVYGCAHCHKVFQGKPPANNAKCYGKR